MTKLFQSNLALLSEMAYPANFSLEVFSKLHTFKERIAYCKSRLKQLGVGSSRIAFQVDDTKVLKIAKNRKGIAQNEHESEFGRNNYGCFAELFNYDDKGYTWIEIELARRAKAQDFKKFFGVTLDFLSDILEYIYSKYHSTMFYKPSEKVKKYIEDEIYSEHNMPLYELYTYVSDYQPDMATLNDWKAISNWGVVNRNGKEKLVIIDDGFNENVYNKFYKRF